MKKNDKERSIAKFDLIILLISFFISSIIFYFILKNKIILSEISSIKDVFQSVITSVSIIIGFSSSFYSILIALKDSYLLKSIRKNKYKRNELQNSLIFTSLFSFFSLITSILLIIFINYSNLFVYLMFSFWAFFSISLFLLLFKIVFLCLFIVISYDPEKIDKKSD